jgi:hypothetical protein
MDDRLMAKAVQHIFTFSVGKWKKQCFSTVILDLDDAIKEKDKNTASNLICLASRLADAKDMVTVKAYIKQLRTNKLIKPEYEVFCTSPKEMKEEKLHSIYVKIGGILIREHMHAKMTQPYQTLRTQLLNRTATPKKKMTKAEREKEEEKKAALERRKHQENRLAKKKSKAASSVSSDEEDDSDSSSSSSGSSDSDTDSSSSEEETQISADPLAFSPEKRNTLICTLMLLVYNVNARALLVGNLLKELSDEGGLKTTTLRFLLERDIPILTLKGLGQLFKGNLKMLNTQLFELCIEQSFSSVRSQRLEILTELAKRNDLSENGCKLLGKHLALTGIMFEDRRRTFSQIEVRALLSEVSIPKKEHKQTLILKGYDMEMIELSKLPMKTGTTPEPSDAEDDDGDYDRSLRGAYSDSSAVSSGVSSGEESDSSVSHKGKKGRRNTKQSSSSRGKTSKKKK